MGRGAAKTVAALAGVTRFPQDTIVVEFKVEVARTGVATVGDNQLEAVGFVNVTT